MIDDDAGYLAGAKTAGLQTHHFTDSSTLEQFLGERNLLD